MTNVGYCSMTGIPIWDTGDGIWEDGEWISWEYINGQLHAQELKEQYPKASIELIDIFESLVSIAIEHKEVTGRYLQIWGELGELYAEIQYGIKRHSPGTQGSDGRLGNDWVEVKTISPEKSSNTVQVKQAGNFNKLLVVKISEEFAFESKIIDRKDLKKSGSKHVKASWVES